ncbi:MBL fold metallo-hydrolase [Nakamurella sp. PAMC28650]|uniref:MBL fold metallo-hydrolase n=1 Tax=Nakamurella sp. PAMC28650 TaxID=2762325 RepID=UPI001C9A8543|nr:MBL fold metallo-hydrolase [Nakamurella sp. PAMC28650]
MSSVNAAHTQLTSTFWPAVSRPASADPDLALLLGADDVGSPFPELMIKEMPYPGYDPASYRLQPVTVTRRLQDREWIELGGRTLTVLHLPGHTPGSIALLEETTGVLYAGDVIYDGYLIDDLPESDIAAYRQSMDVLANLDVSVVHPGHGRSFDQVRLRELTAKYLDRSRPEDSSED